MTQTILVVDDEPEIVRLVRAYLEQDGFCVVTALDGQEALYVARHEKPDLVVLDVLMPRMDGLDIQGQGAGQQGRGRGHVRTRPPTWPTSCAPPSPSSRAPWKRCWTGSTPPTGRTCKQRWPRRAPSPAW